MSLADTKIIYGSAATAGGFTNEESWTKVTYDFSDDTGAVADYDIFTAGADLVITDYYMSVSTAVTSPAGAILDVGLTDGGVELGSNITTATLAAGYVVSFPAGGVTKLRVAKDSDIVMGIESSTFTAGVIDFYFKTKFEG